MLLTQKDHVPIKVLLLFWPVRCKKKKKTKKTDMVSFNYFAHVLPVFALPPVVGRCKISRGSHLSQTLEPFKILMYHLARGEYFLSSRNLLLIRNEIFLNQTVTPIFPLGSKCGHQNRLRKHFLQGHSGAIRGTFLGSVDRQVWPEKTRPHCPCNWGSTGEYRDALRHVLQIAFVYVVCGLSHQRLLWIPYNYRDSCHVVYR